MIKVRFFNHDDDELREKNIETVRKYMSMPGKLTAERYRLFVESKECTSGLQYTSGGEPGYVTGYDEIVEYSKWNAEHFSTWEWKNIRIIETPDPNYILVECDGSGIGQLSGFEQFDHKGHFIHTFRMDNGKILHYREYMNPAGELLELGLHVPDVRYHDL